MVNYHLILSSHLSIGMINLDGELCATKAEFGFKVRGAVLIFGRQIVQETFLRLCHRMCLDGTILINFQIHVVKVETTCVL